jgi:hypothetical protein
LLVCFCFIKIFHSFRVLLIKWKIALQNWGDYADMTQAVLLFVTFASEVLLICWCGTQLTQYVRKIGVFVSCYGLANSSHVAAIKCLINKHLFVFVTRWSPSWWKMCDAIILTFSVHYRFPTISVTATLSIEEAKTNATHMWPRKVTRLLNW